MQHPPDNIVLLRSQDRAPCTPTLTSTTTVQSAHVCVSMWALVRAVRWCVVQRVMRRWWAQRPEVCNGTQRMHWHKGKLNSECRSRRPAVPVSFDANASKPSASASSKYTAPFAIPAMLSSAPIALPYAMHAKSEKIAASGSARPTMFAIASTWIGWHVNNSAAPNAVYSLSSKVLTSASSRTRHVTAQPLDDCTL